MVCAALTLLRGYVAAKRPIMKSKPLGSYEDWDRLVRQCVLWLKNEIRIQVDDPINCVDVAKGRDPVLNTLGQFLDLVWAAKKETAWTTTELMRKASPELYTLLKEIAGERDTINIKRLGKRIKAQVDKRRDGRRLTRCDALDRKGVALWRIESGGRLEGL